MRRFISFGPALVVLLTALVTLVAAPAAVRMIGYADTEARIRLARQNLDEDNILKAIDRATRAVADAVEPSVVHIAVREPGRFGWERAGTGSGWVFDDQGHIVTNAHVVRSARNIMVQFQDGRAVSARVIGQDPSTDIAVLKADTAEGLFPVRRATDLRLQQGDRVFAFGSPFGFKFSMSEGIVSGLGRDPQQITGSGGFTNFIQTDAAVNPGNSGGPLVNVEGKLVGMNVAIATAPSRDGEGQNSGISFAIPLETIEPVVEQLISTGIVAKGYLGVQRPLNDDDNSRRLATTDFRGRGVFLLAVTEDSPAAQAGMQAGDIITKINDREIATVAGFRLAIATNAPGDRINVEFWRGGTTRTVQVTLGELPPSGDEMEAAFAALRRFGVAVADGDQGITVVAVGQNSGAFGQGVRPEHTITAVEGEPVRTLRELAMQLARKGLQQGRPVKITVLTNIGQELEVNVTP